MKKIYTAIALFVSCLFMTANAQLTQSKTELGSLSYSTVQLFPLSGNIPQPLTTTTLVPTSYSYTCASTQALYSFNIVRPIVVDSGYVFGNNVYGETGCAQKYLNYTGSISQLLVRVGHKAGTTGNTYGEIYSINPATRKPQALSGTTSAVTTGSITTTGFTAYTFTTSITVTNGFFAAVVLPTTAGDTIGIVSNKMGCSTTDSLSWLNVPSFGGWMNVPTVFGSNTDISILAVGDVNVGVNEYSSNGLSLLGAYPNPANDFTTLRYRLEEPSTVSIEVFDLTGRVIEKSSENLSSGNHDIKVSAKNLSSGNYYYTIKTDKSQLTSKFIVTK